jgi:hypothetical protein
MRRILEDADNNDSRPSKRPRYEDDIATQSTRSSSVDDEIQSNTADPNPEEYLKVQSTAQTTHDQGDPASSSQKQQEDTRSQLSPPQLASSLQEQSTVPRHQLDTTNQVKAKRDEVRKAHRYLQEHCDLEKLQLGHFPSSWSEEEDIANNEGNTQKSPRLTPPAPSNKNPESLQHPSNVDEDWAESPQPHDIHPTTNTDSQHTDTLSISISESLLAPSATENEEPSSEDPNEAREQRAQVVRDRMKARTRVRVDAFLAAMRDTYESWADMAMVSAGDNHTEEEMEL